VATAAGGLLALNLAVGFSVLSTWLIVSFVFRYSSLAAICASLVAPFFCILAYPTTRVDLSGFSASVILLLRHKGNIVNLLNGTESKIGSKGN
jgi:glycerol-3-phosphate acyltransferase PlsY